MQSCEENVFQIINFAVSTKFCYNTYSSIIVIVYFSVPCTYSFLISFSSLHSTVLFISLPCFPPAFLFISNFLSSAVARSLIPLWSSSRTSSSHQTRTDTALLGQFFGWFSPICNNLCYNKSHLPKIHGEGLNLDHGLSSKFSPRLTVWGVTVGTFLYHVNIIL